VVFIGPFDNQRNKVEGSKFPNWLLNVVDILLEALEEKIDSNHYFNKYYLDKLITQGILEEHNEEHKTRPKGLSQSESNHLAHYGILEYHKHARVIELTVKAKKYLLKIEPALA